MNEFKIKTFKIESKLKIQNYKKGLVVRGSNPYTLNTIS